MSDKKQIVVDDEAYVDDQDDDRDERIAEYTAKAILGCNVGLRYGPYNSFICASANMPTDEDPVKLAPSPLLIAKTDVVAL